LFVAAMLAMAALVLPRVAGRRRLVETISRPAPYLALLAAPG
jgi:hypothetical protein